MTKPVSKTLTKAANSAGSKSAGSSVEAFTFGDTEPVLNGSRFMQMLECWHNGRWYEPPVNPVNLSQSINIQPHHRSAIGLKKNLLVKHFIPHRLLGREDFAPLVLDYLVQANAYVERVRSRSGSTLAVKHVLAQNTRRGVKADQFWFLEYGNGYREHEFEAGSVFQLREHDVSQEIYGIPEYMPALQSALLNEAATLFRRRYYINGAHAGFVMYISEAGLDDDDAETIKTAVQQAKGVGNFKNLFLHIPNGKKEGIQILPISEVAAKDEFLGIKNTTRDDVLASHRTPPQLMGVVPANAGGFGDVEKAAAVFHAFEIEPLQERFKAINDWLGEEVIRFTPYVPIMGSGQPS